MPQVSQFDSLAKGKGLRFIASILSFVFLVQLNWLVLPAFAEPVSFTPETQSASASLQGKVPAKVGALLAFDAMIILNGQEIKVESKSGTSSPTGDLLSGILLNPKIEGGTDAKNVTGYAFFTGGSKYERMRKVRCHESISLYNGTQLRGKITEVSKDGCTIDTPSGTQKVAAGDISAIHSARAYKFSMPVSPSADPNKPTSADVPKLVFNPTCAAISGGISQGSTPKKVFIVLAAATLVATAIAVPVAVGVATHHHHHAPTQSIFVSQQSNLPKLPVITPKPAAPIVVVRPSSSVTTVPVKTVPVTTVPITTVPTKTVPTTTVTTRGTIVGTRTRNFGIFNGVVIRPRGNNAGIIP